MTMRKLLHEVAMRGEGDIDTATFSADSRPWFIVTANAEMMLAARTDSELADIMRQADYVLAESAGIVKALAFLGIGRKKRLPGIDFAEHLFQNPPLGLRRVFLVGGKNGAAEEAARTLGRRFPMLQFEGFSAIELLPDGTPKASRQEGLLLAKIAHFKPQMLLAGFGIPKQEKWLRRAILAPQGHWNLGIAMGIGGALDIWAGRLTRAPKILRNHDLEWLWRLLQEPWRAPRIFNATVVFPLRLAVERMTHRTQGGRVSEKKR